MVGLMIFLMFMGLYVSAGIVVAGINDIELDDPDGTPLIAIHVLVWPAILIYLIARPLIVRLLAFGLNIRERFDNAKNI